MTLGLGVLLILSVSVWPSFSFTGRIIFLLLFSISLSSLWDVHPSFALPGVHRSSPLPCPCSSSLTLWLAFLLENEKLQ